MVKKIQRLIACSLAITLVWTSGGTVEAAMALCAPSPERISHLAFLRNQEKVRLEMDALNLQAVNSRVLLENPRTFPFLTRLLQPVHPKIVWMRWGDAIGLGVSAIAAVTLRAFGLLGAPSGVMMACGNLGVLLRRLTADPDILPVWVQDFMERAGHATRIRGEQAVGRLIYAKSPAGSLKSIRKRMVNRKRDTLPVAFRKIFNRELFRAQWKGLKAPNVTYLAMEHYRYGTSSAPAVKETHPHQWTPDHNTTRWVMEGGRLVQRTVVRGHYITHNGDFDEWGIYGAYHGLDALVPWLERVLHVPHALKGDSPKVAGMIDVLLTEGMTDASVRLAFLLSVATSLNDTPLSLDEIHLLSARLDSILEKHAGTLVAWGSPQLAGADPQETERVIEAYAQSLQADPVLARRLLGREKAFARTAVHVFLHNNLETALRSFVKGARGSFGLVVASTLYPDRVALATLGQPLSVGFHPEEGLVAYASEVDALKAPLGEGRSPIPYRLDLDQDSGEIMELGTDTLRLYSLRQDRELSEKEIAARLIDLKDNPYITPLPDLQTDDPVGHDLKDIPRVLQAIHRDWADPASLNRQTAAEFTRLVEESLRRPKRRQEGETVDILIPAIENSLWLAEAFAGELRKAFPGLRVATTSANKVLQALEEVKTTPRGFSIQMDDLGRLYRINERTITMPISQSAQTFGPLNAVYGLYPLYERNHQNRLFVMSGTLDSLMGSAIRQPFTRGAPFGRRIFTNGSGRRTAEPSTVAVDAVRMTLNELFLRMARDIRQKHPAEVNLTEDDLTGYEQKLDELVNKTAPALTGHDAEGNAIPSSVYQKLVDQGRQWGNHILEPAKVIGLGAIFLFSVYVLAIPLLPSCVLTPALTYVGWYSPILVHTVDWILFITLPWVLALVLRRLIEHRPAGARLGKRTLVLVDVPYIHQLLRAYVSRLFSMSYGHASIDVRGASADHAIHRYAHEVVRGTLLYLGIPEGRWRWLKNSESAVRMVGAQSKGIRNFNVGAEVVAVGSRVESNPNQMDIAIELRPGEPVSPVADSRFTQEIYESQFDAFERLIAGQVFFWAMAKRVSSFWPLGYDMSRTQSGTRIATTRSPYPAPDLARATHITSNPELQDAFTGPPVRIHHLMGVDRVEQTPEYYEFEVKQPYPLRTGTVFPAGASLSGPRLGAASTMQIAFWHEMTATQEPAVVKIVLLFRRGQHRVQVPLKRLPAGTWNTIAIDPAFMPDSLRGQPVENALIVIENGEGRFRVRRGVAKEVDVWTDSAPRAVMLATVLQQLIMGVGIAIALYGAYEIVSYLMRYLHAAGYFLKGPSVTALTDPSIAHASSGIAGIMGGFLRFKHRRTTIDRGVVRTAA